MTLSWFRKNKEWATLPLRLLLAFIFIPAGWNKITNLAGTTGFFDGLGIPLAGLFAFVVAIVELLGGIAVLIGFFTRYAAVLLNVIMVVAILVAHLGGGYERAAIALVAGLSLLFSGAGPLSLDAKYCKHKK